MDHVIPIPNGISSEEAAPVLCAGVTVYSAMKHANAIAGNWIAISGAGGGLGSFAIQYAAAMGLRVIAIDAGEDKRALALSLGAEMFVDFTESSNLIAEIMGAVGGGGPHFALLTTASTKAFSQAIFYTRALGTILCVGIPAQPASGVSVASITSKGLKLFGCKTGNRQASIEALDLVVRGKVRSHYQERPFAAINEVLEQMKQGTLAGRVVLKF